MQSSGTLHVPCKAFSAPIPLLPDRSSLRSRYATWRAISSTHWVRKYGCAPRISSNRPPQITRTCCRASPSARAVFRQPQGQVRFKCASSTLLDRCCIAGCVERYVGWFGRFFEAPFPYDGSFPHVTLVTFHAHFAVAHAPSRCIRHQFRCWENHPRHGAVPHFCRSRRVRGTV